MVDGHDRGVAAAALADAYRRGRMFAGGLALIVGGRVVEETAAGTTTGAGFEIGSITKMLTAVTALRASRQGRLDIDAVAESLIPGFSFEDRRGDRATIRHLLSHSSGLPAAGRDWGPTDPDALMRFAVEDLRRHGFHADPGEIGCYSSTAISLVGLALQEQLGAPFPDLLRSSVLEPSGMRDATFPGDIDAQTVSWPHSRAGSSWVPVKRLADNPAGYPSGFLFASLEDLTRFSVTMLEGSLLVGVDAMFDHTIPRWMDHAPSPLARVSAHYGLGSLIGEWNGQTVIRHGGSQLSSHCSIDFFPESGGALVLLTNGADDVTFMELLAHGYRELAGAAAKIAPLRREHPAPARVHAAVGSYLDFDGGTVTSIALRDHGLVLELGGDETPLEYVGEGRWLASSAVGEIPIGIPWSGESVDHVVIWGNLYSRIEPVPCHAPTEPVMFQGRYADSFWDDPTTRITVRAPGRDLVVETEGIESVARWIGPNRLVSEHGLIEFEPDGSGFVLGRATRYMRIEQLNAPTA